MFQHTAKMCLCPGEMWMTGQWKGESTTEACFHVRRKYNSCSHRISNFTAILKVQEPSFISCLLSLLQISYSCQGLQNESVREWNVWNKWKEMERYGCKEIFRKVSFPCHSSHLTIHLSLVSPSDSLHGSGGVRSCSGPQPRWVSHAVFPPFLYLHGYLEKYMHKILLGRHSCG